MKLILMLLALFPFVVFAQVDVEAVNSILGVTSSDAFSVGVTVIGVVATLSVYNIILRLMSNLGGSYNSPKPADDNERRSM